MSSRSIRSSFHVLAYDEGAFSPHPQLPQIIMDHGQLVVGDVPILHPRFDGHQITWRQRTAGHFTAGHLYVHGGGLSVHGSVSVGATPQSAQLLSVVGTAVKPVVYRTRLTTGRYAPGTAPSTVPDSGWADGPELEIGYDTPVGKTVPEPFVLLDGNDITSNTHWSYDPAGNTVLVIAIDDTTCLFAPQLIKNALIAFNPYVPVPPGVGQVAQLCSASGPPPADVQLWSAVATAPALKTRQLAAIAPEQLLGDSDLSLVELMTLIPNDTVNELSQQILMRNMKWAMGQNSEMADWLSKFLGQEPPVITAPDELALANQSLDWYQNHFAIAYLTKGFQSASGPEAPTDHRLSAGQEAALNEWFKSGLASQSDFTIQHKGIFIEAYRTADSRLSAYVADTASNWAQTLHDTLISPPQLVPMVNRVAGVAGDPNALVPLNNLACLLTALAPDGKLASDYYQTVLTGVVNHAVPNCVHKNASDIMAWLPTALQELLREFALNGVPDGVDISAQEAKDMYEEYLKHKGDIEASLADLISSINATGLIDQAKQLENGVDNLVKQWPKLAKLSKLMFATLWIGSVASVISTLVVGDWSKMSDIQKAQFVTSIAQTAMQGFEAVPMIYNGIKSMTLPVWQKLTNRFNQADQLDGIQAAADEVAPEGDFVAAAASELTPMVAAGGEAGAGAFARIFAEGLASGVVKIFGALASAAMAAYSLWQLIDDIKNHGSVSTEVFDSLIFAANLASAVCLTIGLFATSAVFPIAGAVLALVGTILSIVESFEEKPANPVDDWMRDHGIPFVQGIPPASAAPASPVPALLRSRLRELAI